MPDGSSKDEWEARRRKIAENGLRVEAIVTHINEMEEEHPDPRALLHAILDACIDLAAIGQSGWNTKRLARDLGQELLEGAVGWAGYYTHDIDKFEKNSDGKYSVTYKKVYDPIADPVQFRRSAVHMLETSPSLVPPEIKSEIIAAIRRLDKGDGHTPLLLKPFREAGKGLNPTRARHLEIELTRWVAWESGRCGKVVVARAKVAAEANVGTDLVESWRRDLLKDRVSDFWTRELEKLRISGQEGKPFLMEDDDGQKEVTLSELCIQWRTARTPAKARPRKK